MLGVILSKPVNAGACIDLLSHINVVIEKAML